MVIESKHSYPSEEECLELIKKFEMFPNIIDHSIQVRNVSEAIYHHIIDKSQVCLKLIIASALLHDIAKTRSIQLKELRHDLIGGEMLRSLGYDEIAEIVENHVVFNGFNAEGPLTEKEIIYYADKRVMHDRIVSIDTRVSDLVSRYGKTDRIREMIIENKKFVLKLELKIQSFLDTDIEQALKNL